MLGAGVSSSGADSVLTNVSVLPAAGPGVGVVGGDVPRIKESRIFIGEDTPGMFI